MTSNRYTNIAFISYKREDEQWAKWLQKKLEHYKLPTEILKQNPEIEFSEHPRHVFKDTTDLSGGVLAKAIKDGLDSSKFLIVICSPRAAKSEWVCKEVQDFIDSGREEYIIPFIIDGEPYAKDPENECFPAALKTLAGEKELLGININENGRDSAAVKVVARVFDLRFDTLWNRFQREQKKRRKYTICGLIAIILILIGIGAWIGKLYYQQNIIYKELKAKNYLVETQNRELNAKSDSIAVANGTLEQRNGELTTERNNVIQANWKIMEAVGRAAAEKAHTMIDDGNVYTAMRILLSQVPQENERRPLVDNVKDELFRAVSLFQNGRHKVQVLGHEMKDLSFADATCRFSNSGGMLIYKYKNEMTMYDTRNGIPLYNCYLEGDFVGFADDDKEFYVKQGNKLIAVDAYTGKVKKTYSRGDTSDVAFVTDKFQCTIEKGKGLLQLWNIEGDLILEKAFPFAGTIVDIGADVYPSTDKLVVAHKQGISVIELGKNFKTTNYPHLSFGAGIHYSENEKYVATCSADSTATVWDAELGNRIRSIKLKSHAAAAYLSKDGKTIVTLAKNLFSSEPSGIITLWDVRSGHILKEYGQGYLKSFENERTICAIVPGDKLKIINPFTGKIVSTLGLPGTLRSFDISFKKRLAVFVPNEGKCTLWNVSAGTYIKIPAHTDYSKSSFGERYMIRDIQLNKEGDRLLSAGNDNLIKVWKYPEMTREFTMRGHLDEPYSIQLSNNGERLLSSAADSTARVWSLTNTSEVFRLKHDNPCVSGAKYTSDGKYVLSVDNVSVYVWDANCGKLIRKLQPTTSNNGKMSFELLEDPRNPFYDPATNTITVAYSSGMLRQWNLYTGALLYEIKAYDRFCKILPTEDKKNFYTWSESNDIHLWETHSMRRIKTLSGHENKVDNVAFRPHHSQLVSCGTDGRVILWDAITNEKIEVLTNDYVDYQQISFSEDGRYVIAGNCEDIVKMFDLNTGELVFSLKEPGLYTCPILDKKNRNLIVPKTDGYIEVHPIKSFPQVVNKAKSILGEWQLSEQELYYFNLK